MTVRFDVESNIVEFERTYGRAADGVVKHAKRMADAQEQLVRSLKKTGGSGGGEAATAARVSADAQARAEQTVATATRARKKATEESTAAIRQEDAELRKRINSGLQALKVYGDERAAFIAGKKEQLARAAAYGTEINLSRVLGQIKGQLTKLESDSAVAARAKRKAVDESATAMKREEVVAKQLLNTGLAALSSYGGESRAYAQRIKDHIRRAEVAGQEINYVKQLATVSARLAHTDPGDRFTKSAVDARDLGKQLLNLNSTIGLLSTNFGAFGPAVLHTFSTISTAVAAARKEMSEYIASVKIGASVANFEGAGAGRLGSQIAGYTAGSQIPGAALAFGGGAAGATLPSTTTRILAKLGSAGFLIPAATLTASAAAMASLIKRSNDLEVALDEVSAITGITGQQLDQLGDTAIRLAASTGKSSTDIALGFKLVASASPELILVAGGIEKVTAAAITLSQASGDDLATSVTAVTAVLAQFRLGVDDTTRVIDALTTGSRIGAVEVPGLTEAISRTGSIAGVAGIKLEELIATIETLGKSRLPLDIISTGLRNIIIRLQTSGNLTQGESLFDALRKVEKQGLSTTEMVKLFGRYQITAAQFLLQNLDVLERYTKELYSSTSAQDTANIRLDNLTGSLGKAASAWGAFLTAISKTKPVEVAKDALKELVNEGRRVAEIATATVLGGNAPAILVAKDNTEEQIRAKLKQYEQIATQAESRGQTVGGTLLAELDKYRAALRIKLEETHHAQEEMLRNSIGFGDSSPPDLARNDELLANLRQYETQINKVAAAEDQYAKAESDVGEAVLLGLRSKEEGAAFLAQYYKATVGAAMAHTEYGKTLDSTAEKEIAFQKTLQDSAQALDASITKTQETRAKLYATQEERLTAVSRDTDALDAQRQAIQSGGVKSDVEQRAEARALEEINRQNLEREALRQEIAGERDKHRIRLQNALDEFKVRIGYVELEKQLVAKQITPQQAGSTAQRQTDDAIRESDRRFNAEIANIQNLTRADEERIRALFLANEKAKDALQLTKDQQKRIQDAMQEPWKNAAENIQRNFGDTVVKMLDKVLGKARGFWGLMLDMIKRFIAEAAVLKLFGNSFGQIAAGGQNGGSGTGIFGTLFNSLLGGGGGGEGGSGLIGKLLSKAVGYGGSVLGTLFSGGSSTTSLASSLTSIGIDGNRFPLLLGGSVESGAAAGVKTGLSGFFSSIGGKIGNLFTGSGGSSFFGNLGSLFAGSGGGSAGALGGLAPAIGFAVGQFLGRPGIGRTIISSGLGISGLGLAGYGSTLGAFGASLAGPTLGAGASAIGINAASYPLLTGAGTGIAAGVGGAAGGTATSAIGSTLSLIGAYLPIIGYVIAAIGYAYGNLSSGGIGEQAGHFARTGENVYAGENPVGTAFKVGLSTGSPWFALAAGIGAMQDPARAYFRTSTTAQDQPGYGAESPFGFVNLAAANSEIRHKGGAFKMIKAIAKFDEAISKLLDPSEIERVSAALQGSGTSGFAGKLEHAGTDFADLLARRAREIITTLEGEAAGAAFKKLVNKPTVNLREALGQTFTAREQYHTAIDQLSGKEVLQFTATLEQMQNKLKEATAIAEKFGFDVGALTDAFNAGVIKVAQASIDANKLIILNSVDPLAAALYQQAKDAEKAIADARAIGAETGLKAVVYAEAAAAIQRQQIIEDYAEKANASLRALRDQLTIGELGGLSTTSRYQNALQAFYSERADVQNRPYDITQRNELVSSIQTLIQLSREQFGSGTGFQNDRTLGLNTLDWLENLDFTGANINLDNLTLTPATTNGSTAASGSDTTLTLPDDYLQAVTTQTNTALQDLEVTQDIRDELEKLNTKFNDLTAKLDNVLSDIQRLI